MDISAVRAVGDSADSPANALQSSSHNFMLRVQAAIGPKQLDGNGHQGRVLVAFSLSERGQLMGVRLAQSSGSDYLDSMAMQIVGRATFPVPPVGSGVVNRTYVSAFTFG